MHPDPVFARGALIAAVVIASIAPASAQLGGPPPGATSPPPATSDGNAAPFDVEKLFANTCGWCHSNAGRTAGRGPKLMGTTLTDAEIVYRIRNGKTGAMPAFGSTFNDEQLRAIVQYIRNLKDDAR
jgi:mono/diheme cytochrome c family protein